MAAEARVLARTMAVRTSCGSESNRTTMLPAPGERSASCRACQGLKEKQAGFREREEKACPGKHQDDDYGYNRHRLHGKRMPETRCLGHHFG